MGGERCGAIISANSQPAGPRHHYRPPISRGDDQADRTLLLLAQATPDTVVCRCESLTRPTSNTAIDAGPASPNVLNSATSCCMGPCGDFFCGDSAAALITAGTGRSMEGVGQMTYRPPLAPAPHGPTGGRLPTFRPVVTRTGPAMTVPYDLIVVGGGIMGSAAATRLPRSAWVSCC